MVQKEPLKIQIKHQTTSSIVLSKRIYPFPKRKTFIIDKNGVIVHIIDSVNVSTHNDIILSVLDSLMTRVELK